MLWLGIAATIGANIAYGAGYGLRLVAIPRNTARPSADPSWKEAVIRAAANPA